MSNNAHCVSAYHSIFPRSWEPSGTLEHDLRRRYADVPFTRAAKEIGDAYSTAGDSVILHLTYLNNLSYPAIIQLTNSGPVYKGNPGVRVTIALAYFFFFRTSCLQGR